MAIHDILDDYIPVTDAEEEVCELYSTYYSTDGTQRQALVDQTQRQVELEIQTSNGSSKSLTVEITQNPCINQELGQTGACLWSSSIVMSEFLARKSKDWNIGSLSVLEMGSGCGLVGIVLHQLGARRVILTDQSRAMKLLNKNMQNNQTKGGGEIFATEYRWGEPVEDLRIIQEPIDLVVASDCVYHEEIAPLLVKSMADLCKDQERPVVGLIGQELRSDLVHQTFLEALLRHFQVHRIPLGKQSDGYYTLYLVKLK